MGFRRFSYQQPQKHRLSHFTISPRLQEQFGKLKGNVLRTILTANKVKEQIRMHACMHEVYNSVIQRE